MDPVHVAFCCDSAYLEALTVAVRSVIDHTRDPRRLHFWILAQDDEQHTFAPAARIAQEAGAAWTPLPASTVAALLQRMPTRGHITQATYYRLFLPEVLPERVERFVYLDSDVVVRRPIEDLWSTDLEGHTLAAVMKPRASEYRDVGLQSETDYFNSGVLVIDARRWRAAGVRDAALGHAIRDPHCLHGHDQPALNRVFAGRWKRLDLRWNQQFKFFVHTAGYLRLPRAELRRLRRDPFIIHYTTSSKPWHYTNDHPLRHCYYDALDRTPFAGRRPAPASWRDRLLRLITPLVPHYLRPGILRNVYRPHYHRLQLALRRHHPAHG